MHDRSHVPWLLSLQFTFCGSWDAGLTLPCANSFSSRSSSSCSAFTSQSSAASTLSSSVCTSRILLMVTSPRWLKKNDLAAKKFGWTYGQMCIMYNEYNVFVYVLLLIVMCCICHHKSCNKILRYYFSLNAHVAVFPHRSSKSDSIVLIMWIFRMVGFPGSPLFLTQDTLGSKSLDNMMKIFLKGVFYILINKRDLIHHSVKKVENLIKNLSHTLHLPRLFSSQATPR